MGMLLTDAQRKWVDILKESAKSKPPDNSIKPQVCTHFCIIITPRQSDPFPRLG